MSVAGERRFGGEKVCLTKTKTGKQHPRKESRIYVPDERPSEKDKETK